MLIAVLVSMLIKISNAYNLYKMLLGLIARSLLLSMTVRTYLWNCLLLSVFVCLLLSMIV